MAHLTLGGRDRDVRYEWKAIRRLKNEYDINLLDGSAEDAGYLADPQVLTALVWAGCLHETPSLTLDEVDTWLSFQNMVAVSEAVWTALAEALTPTTSSSAS